MDVTVAICMWNAEKTIENTLQCLLEQTMQDFDLLIVDDCSTDDSVKCVEHFFEQHYRQYEVVRQPMNQGIAYERNFALHHARTKYMVFVDSDDLPKPQFLEKQYSVIVSDEELIGVGSWSQFINSKGKEIKGGLFIGDTTKEEFRKRAEAGKRIFLPIQTLFVREDAIRVGGFRLDGFPEGKPRYRDFCEDLDLWTRMSDLYGEGKYIIVLPEVLYLYRKTDGLSSNHFHMIIKMEYVKVNVRRRRKGLPECTFIEYYESLKHEELARLKKDSHAADCLRNGVFYVCEGKLLKGLRFIVESVWNNPTYIFDKIMANSGLVKKS